MLCCLSGISVVQGVNVWAMRTTCWNISRLSFLKQTNEFFVASNGCWWPVLSKQWWVPATVTIYCRDVKRLSKYSIIEWNVCLSHIRFLDYAARVQPSDIRWTVNDRPHTYRRVMRSLLAAIQVNAHLHCGQRELCREEALTSVIAKVCG